MKFLTAIIFGKLLNKCKYNVQQTNFNIFNTALFFVCAVQAQRGFLGNRHGQKPIQGGGAKADCPNFCPLNYQPTCGFNGRCYKEFSNTCALNVAACNGEGSKFSYLFFNFSKIFDKKH